MPNHQIIMPIGTRFGMLVTTGNEVKRGKERVHECRCDCGEISFVYQHNLRNLSTRSCGCLIAKGVSIRNRKHGHTTKHGVSRTYSSWISMLKRCYQQSSPSYSRYGGRGIEVCERWRESFSNFLEDMGLRPVGKTIDRYPDNKGNYRPGNCRWATPQEQAANRTYKLTSTSSMGVPL